MKCVHKFKFKGIIIVKTYMFYGKTDNNNVGLSYKKESGISTLHLYILYGPYMVLHMGLFCKCIDRTT